MAESTSPKWMIWVGRVLTALPALGLVMSAFMKITANPQAVEGFAKGGWPAGVLRPLGAVELLCVVLVVVPQTAVLGLILATGYLGGAVATHVRAGEGFLAPVLFAVLLWGGLFCRDARIRALLPLRKPE